MRGGKGEEEPSAGEVSAWRRGERKCSRPPSGKVVRRDEGEIGCASHFPSLFVSPRGASRVLLRSLFAKRPVAFYALGKSARIPLGEHLRAFPNAPSGASKDLEGGRRTALSGSEAGGGSRGRAFLSFGQRPRDSAKGEEERRGEERRGEDGGWVVARKSERIGGCAGQRQVG
ncbi:hypothetical protein KM043_012342 [Ampulex compressa]|nr:hypothetical protein KM043_012342 [Ampulex compressa]